jgi:hypothetical protein
MVDANLEGSPGRLLVPQWRHPQPFHGLLPVPALQLCRYRRLCVSYQLVNVLSTQKIVTSLVTQAYILNNLLEEMKLSPNRSDFVMDLDLAL